jgi:hypothetical protein
VAAPPPPKGFQVLTAPVDIPDVIPDIDLSKKVTDENDFSGKGVAGGTPKGVEGGKAVVQSDQPYFEFQVEKPVVPAPGSTSPALSGHAPAGRRRGRSARSVRRRHDGQALSPARSRSSSPRTTSSSSR